MRWIKFNWTNIFLLAGLVAAPISGLMLHLRLHADITYLTYILWFDILIITALYLFNKTRFTAFVLNSVFFIVGVIMHMIVEGGIGDVLLALPGFAIGWTLWILNRDFEESNLVKPGKKSSPKKKK